MQQNLQASIFPLLVLCLVHMPVVRPACTANRDLVMTASFVDVYGTDLSVPYMPLLPAKDGGVYIAATRSISSGPRIVKLNSAAKFQWFTEQRAQADIDGGYNYRYYSKSLTEDPTGQYLYVGGYVATSVGGNPLKGFIMKYNLWDGSYVNSYLGSFSAAYRATINSLAFDSDGNILFGGCYYAFTPTHYYLWLATVDQYTMIATPHTVTSAIDDPAKAFKIGMDGATGLLTVLGAVNTLAPYIWVAGVHPVTWRTAWEHACSSCTSTTVRAMLKLSYNTYAFHAIKSIPGPARSYYYEVNAYTGFRVVERLLPDSYTMARSPTDSSKIIVAGYATAGDTNPYSFAYYYDPIADYKYDAGATAQRIYMYFLCAGTSARYSWTWVAGYVYDSINVRYIIAAVKLECAAPASCSGGTVDYLNQCYTPTSTGCFGLCATCLVAGNINACATAAAVTSNNQYTIPSLFAGRCSIGGSFYSYSTGLFVSVAQTSCHELCGGECIGSASATSCAHHCKGVSLEPHIDDSLLAQNTCKCQTGWTYSAISKRCVISSSCYVLCSNNECGVAADSTKCISCIVGVNIKATTNGAYTTCVCEDGYALSGNQCLACGTLCATCDSPGNNAHCLACADIQNVVRTGAAAPYTCSCSSGTVYDALTGRCVFETGCHPLCPERCTSQDDSSTCFSGCNPVAQSRLTNTDSLIFTCSCAPGKVYDGSACAFVMTSGCHPLCGEQGCTEINNAERCVDCVSQPKVIRTLNSAHLYTCSCFQGTELVGAVCAYRSDCDILCDGCMEKNNSSACVGCVSGITPVAVDSIKVSCACTENTAYYNSTCTEIITGNSTNSTLVCHPLCRGACVVANDAAKCVDSCAAGTYVVTLGRTGQIVSCGCESGTYLSAAAEDCVLIPVCGPMCQNCTNDDSRCVQCQPGDGILLSEGKCICSEGYIRYSSAAEGITQCIASTNAITQAIQYSGYFSAVTVPRIGRPRSPL